MRLDHNGHKLCDNVKDMMQLMMWIAFCFIRIIGSVVNYDGRNLGKLELMHDKDKLVLAIEMNIFTDESSYTRKQISISDFLQIYQISQ